MKKVTGDHIQPKAFKSKRVMYATLSAIGLLIVISILTGLIWNYLGDQSQLNLSSKYNRDRAAALTQALPSVLNSNGQQVMVFGASSVDGFFSPAQFDLVNANAGTKTETYNLGFRVIHPRQLRLLTLRLKNEFQSKNKKLHASIFRLETSRLTEAFEKSQAGQSDFFDFTSVITTPEMLQQSFNAAPIEAGLILSKKYLHLSSSPSYFRSWFRSFFQTDKDNEENLFFSLWRDRSFEEHPAWDFEKRGLNTWNQDKVKSKLESVLQLKSSSEQVDYGWMHFSECCDLAHLKWNPQLLQVFFDTLEIARSFSNQVIVYYYSEKGSTERRSPQGQGNLDHLLSKLEQAGFTVVNMDQSNPLNPNDYIDLLHLNAGGLEKIYQELSVVLRHQRRSK